jgi:hypothetical protein
MKNGPAIFSLQDNLVTWFWQQLMVKKTEISCLEKLSFTQDETFLLGKMHILPQMKKDLKNKY